ncbi:MAG: hypothetical protein R6W90_15595 [Ignavibacteriaceae bacterium]
MEQVNNSVSDLILEEKQVLGQLFSKEEGDKLFGPVLQSVEIETSLLSGLMEKSSSILMFNIINNEAVILGVNRKPLYPENVKVDEETVFHVYSVSVIRELLESGGSPKTFIEIRPDVMTITNGIITMEMSAYCPPMCFC